MTTAMKISLTAVIALLAAILSLWSGSPVRADQIWLVVAIAAGMVVVMWTFPKAGF
jgi:hypothetical protein